MAINQQGDVVGFADTSGDDPNQANFLHAFLWTKRDGIRDLGTLAGDVFSEALGINDQGQIVGTSCDANGACRAFLYQDGQMTDLNTLVAPGYTDDLTTAQDINDRGEITGRAVNATTGEKPAFLATPLANRR
jgi:probable HAF family extracellular repeat protein